MRVDSSYSQRVHDLAVGFEPRDILAGGQPPVPVRLDIEMPDGVPRRVTNGYSHFTRPSDLNPKISRHISGLYKLIYLQRRQLPDNAIVRIYDDYQYYVPRRFRFPIPAREDISLEQRPRASRRQSPLMFPSNAYPVAERTMGLRGRVLRDGEPMPWAWIDAFYLIQIGGTEANPQFMRRGKIGRAISDRHGEFLLILEPLPQGGVGVPELENPAWVNVVINGPVPAPLEPADNEDTLWAVPVEQLPLGGLPDPASGPNYAPPGYATDIGASANRNIPFPPGKLLTGIDVPDFQFSLP